MIYNILLLYSITVTIYTSYLKRDTKNDGRFVNVRNVFVYFNFFVYYANLK